MRLALLAVLAAAVVAGCGGDDAAAPVAQAETTSRLGEVVDLENVLGLRSDFEQDMDTTRVILLLSPT